MKGSIKTVWRVVATCAAMAVTAVCAYHVAPSTWAVWGKRAVQLVAGVSYPQESLSYLERAFVTAPTEIPAVSQGADVQALCEETVAVPAREEQGGNVKETVIRGAQENGVSVKNNSGVTFDVAALLQRGAPLSKSTSADPRVLIVHTHGSECYMRYFAGYYNDSDPTRSSDTAENVTAVGEAIAQELRAYGVGVIHDVTLHDSPAYTGAYNRSEQTITSYLQRYPTIEVVMDIHRDAMMQADGTKLKPTVTVQGRKAAQVMAVVGGTNTATRPNAYCEDNLRLALAFHRVMEDAYPSIMRPVYVVDARYNQGLKAGSMLLEIGTDANTLSEAVFSGHLVGKELAKMMAES